MQKMKWMIFVNVLAFTAPAQAALTCGQLTALRIPDVRINRASEVKPDPVWMAPLATPPGGYSAQVAKPFCRVEGTIEGDIGFELWLPYPGNWSGRMLGTGNGGFAGFFRYEGLARGVNRSFAAASTDTGHKISETNWSIGGPRALENYGHRAQHLLAVNSKAIIAAYYGRAPDKSYFSGCSGGGMQGLNEVQKYPADYDGIIAGAHGQSIVGISARWLQSALIAKHKPTAHLTQADWQRVADSAVKQCDAQDGIKDGIIGNPPSCRFDVASTPGLSAEQTATARQLYGSVKGRGGQSLYPGFHPGVAYVPISEPGRPGELFAQWLYQNPDSDPRQFDAARDVPLAEAVVPGAAPTNPDLSPFFARGGKMISFHGWNDEIVPAQSTIDYYENVKRYIGAEATARSYKLYLPAGMDHCRGGVGADNFGGSFGPEVPEPTPANDMLMALVDWVEKGAEPGSLVATKLVDGKVAMTRPICPYPLVVRYRGRGNPNSAESFICGK